MCKMLFSKWLLSAGEMSTSWDISSWLGALDSHSCIQRGSHSVGRLVNRPLYILPSYAVGGRVNVPSIDGSPKGTIGE